VILQDSATSIALPGVRRGPPGHGSEYPGRRWVDTLRTWRLLCVGRNCPDEKGGTASGTNESGEREDQSKNKALVLDAFDTLFNKRDYAAAEKFWSPHYIQHSAHIAPGREGLFHLIKGLPATLKYEPGTIVAEGDFVIVHGRFSDFGLPVNWIAADIVRIKDGVLVEH
jgi:predicted SnoaL-like aldol condensation-catalyzing enzyme